MKNLTKEELLKLQQNYAKIFINSRYDFVASPKFELYDAKKIITNNCCVQTNLKLLYFNY